LMDGQWVEKQNCSDFRWRLEKPKEEWGQWF